MHNGRLGDVETRIGGTWGPEGEAGHWKEPVCRVTEGSASCKKSSSIETSTACCQECGQMRESKLCSEVM